MLVVGLTGGVSCGKSTVAGIMKKHGAVVVDSDRVVHGLMKPGTAEHRRLRKKFGKEIYKALTKQFRLQPRVALGGDGVKISGRHRLDPSKDNKTNDGDK